MARADLFVLCDSLPFSRPSYTQRVKIKTSTGARWLTVPLIHSHSVGDPIRDVRCGGWNDWRERIIDALRGSYAHSPYFRTYFDEIASIVLSSDDNLSGLNRRLIEHLASQLGIRTPIITSTELGAKTQESATDWIISVCRLVNADVFLSGLGGANYQEESLFAKAGIKRVFSDFSHPVYPQKFDGFVAGLSVVDLLFNCGPKSAGLLGV
jgi:hypothetical protein